MKYIPKHLKPMNKKIHKFIINAITAVMATICLCAIAGLDSNTVVALILIAISALWVVLYAWANGYIKGGVR